MRFSNIFRQSAEVFSNFTLINNAVTASEEACLIAVLNKMLAKKPYQVNHWDDVIQGYKEIELPDSKLSSSLTAVFDRLRTTIRDEIDKRGMKGPTKFMPVHVIDLDKTGHIAAHVDSVKFSGCFIAGLSLWSTRVLRLAPDLSQDEIKNNRDKMESFEFILPQRSLYILTGPLRYHYTHEILGPNCVEQFLPSGLVDIERRISCMFRDEL